MLMKLFFNLNETSVLRLGPGKKLKLDERDSIILNSTLTTPKRKKKKYLPKLMLIACLKTIEIDVICLQCSIIAIMNLITTSLKK